jgi:transposase
MSATQAIIPHADIVHDRFHVAKYLGKAVDTVRKQEHSRLSHAGTSPLTGSKYAWPRASLIHGSTKVVVVKTYLMFLNLTKILCLRGFK